MVKEVQNGIEWWILYKYDVMTENNCVCMIPEIRQAGYQKLIVEVPKFN